MSAEKEIAPWYSEIPRNPRMAKLSGTLIIAATIMGFGVWGNTAPISGAVISTGVFVTTGQNKIIQHLEGGVIKQINVREGDVVEAGQELLVLDDTASRAELRRVILRQMRAETIEARLNAEANGRSTFEFPSDLLAMRHDPDIAALMRTQRATFVARQNNMESDIASQRRGIEALEEKIKGSRRQLAALQTQAELIQEELSGKQALLARGYVRKPEVLALQRGAASIQGEMGRVDGDIGDARERIERALEQIKGVRKQAIKTASEQLQEVGAELNDARERARSARNVLERTRLLAPVRGTVVKLRYHTSSGVIEPGKAIMEIVPLSGDIIIETHVRPQDIDKIKHSQMAAIRLTALNQRTTPMASGKVIYISADALPDEKQRAYPSLTDLYVVRIRLDSASVEGVHDFSPTPGMPAEVYIQTAERTFFQYLMQPITDSMARAFRET